MPRIYTSASDPIDFCYVHFPTEATARKRYGSVGDGPDNRGNCFDYRAEHPNYDDGMDYYCDKCGKHLHDADN